MPDKITITGHSPDASQEWLLYAADEVQADPLANSHAILAVPTDDAIADHRNRVSFWKGVATAVAGSLVLASGMAVVDATFGQQETAHISTPADQAPDKVDRDGTISENEARNIYLADEKRNAGPEFTHSEAVSFSVPCKDQAEIDYYWEKLSAHPENEQCGWCKDKFGLSWQIVPENMTELMQKPGAYKTMMEQHKIIIDEF